MRTPFVVLTVMAAQVGQAATTHASAVDLLAGCAGPALVGAGVWWTRVYSRRRARRRRAEAQSKLERAAELLSNTVDEQRQHEARRLRLEGHLALADAEAFDEGADMLSDPGIGRARRGGTDG